MRLLLLPLLLPLLLLLLPLLLPLLLLLLPLPLLLLLLLLPPWLLLTPRPPRPSFYCRLPAARRAPAAWSRARAASRPVPPNQLAATRPQKQARGGLKSNVLRTLSATMPTPGATFAVKVREHAHNLAVAALCGGPDIAISPAMLRSSNGRATREGVQGAERGGGIRVFRAA